MKPTPEQFQQSMMIAITLLALVFKVPVLLLALAALILHGALYPQHSVFRKLYQKLFAPLPQPKGFQAQHFAQVLGSVFLAAAALFLLSGTLWAAWLFGLAVVVLASINLLTGYCLGCQVYYRFKLIRHQLSEGTQP